MDKKGIDHLDFSPVLKAMKDEGMDALVAMEPHTVAFLLNHWNEILVPIGFREAPACVVITSSGDIFAVAVRMNYNQDIAPWVNEFIGRYTDSSYYDQGRVVQILGSALRKKGLGSGKVGFEMGFVPAGMMDWIKSELPGIEAVDGEWILWQLRAVKTEKQLEFIKKAVAACEAGVQKMREGWKEGESIHRLLDEFEQVVRKHGASFFCTYQRAIAKKWVPFSGRDQRLSEDFIIQTNDEKEVLFDLLVRYQAYFSDWKRSFYLGEPPQEIADLYDFEWRVVQTIAKELKPGMGAIEAQEACDHRLKREGLVNWWCIHSVGLEIHEEPLIGSCPTTSESGEVEKNKTTLFPGLLRGGNQKMTFEPNMVVMAETKSTEDPYLMTKTGLKRLNTLPQQLFVI